MPPKKAVVLLSGGLDSSVALAVALSKGRRVHALTVDYRQRAWKEVEAAKAVARYLGVEEHLVLSLDLSKFGGSALTDTSIDVPEGREPSEIGRDIPATYVPARNTIFLSLGLALAEARDADEVYIAAHGQDYSGYPDCRQEYFEAFRAVALLGTKRGVEGRPIKVLTPLIGMRKADIIKRGAELHVPFDLTWSCYQGRAKACGVCDSCQLRLKGFREAKIEDPIPYEGPSDQQKKA